eukprot:TRINITY_DN72187_c0_g1_i1.p1 TRINITY_DN72187_c0_g1~~TRINITY_DN72187_c0_g1_i1.p1  ORF type:complete len:407 (-),score=78.43 TRINITY_DN72187_c0_g1_i1:61-1221(-)
MVSERRKMLVALALFAPILFAVRASRVLNKGAQTEKVCRVTERLEGIAAIDFAVDVGTCSPASNCNLFHLRSEIATSIIETPTRNPPTGRLGKCKCVLKQTNAVDALSTNGSILVDFIASAQAPCDIAGCWDKYNHFISLLHGVPPTSDHWHVRCEEGSHSVSALKTVSDLYTLAVETSELESIQAHAVKAGIVLGEVAQKPSSPKAPAAPCEESSCVPHVVVESLDRAFSLQELVAQKLAQMMAEADLLFEAARSLARGKATRDWEVAEALTLSMEVLESLLISNMDHLEAFERVVDSQDQGTWKASDAVLESLNEGLDLQRTIIGDMKSLRESITKVRKLLSHPKRKKAEEAATLANGVLERLGKLKGDVQLELGKLHGVIKSL